MSFFDINTELLRLLSNRIVILDGALGTMIQTLRLGETDFRGKRFLEHTTDLKGNNDLLSLTCPEVIQNIHTSYLEAGADIIETNTFNANAISQSDYSLQDIVYELNFSSANIARSAADLFLAKHQNNKKFVAGVLGPTNRTLSISPDVGNPEYRNISFNELVKAYYNAASGLVDGGSDLLLIETVFDTLNAKAAIFAIFELFDHKNIRLPIMISGTITDLSGRTLSGQTPSAFWYSVAHAKPLSIGFNCALGALQMKSFLKELSDTATCPVSVHPNAGWEVLKAGLECVQGKCIVNSISLKEGEEAFIEKARIIQRHGAAMVVMAFDEKGQADTYQKKIDLCEKSYRILTQIAGIAPEDIILDPNIFAIGTGIDEHKNYAVDFLNAVKWIKTHLPFARISGGISNVSFSFRGNATVREAINAAFLFHAIKAGMDMGIVNPTQLAVYDEIPINLRDRVEDVPHTIH